MSDVVIALLGSSVLASLISGTFQLINNRKSKQSKMEDGIKLLLLSAVINDGEKIYSKGNISRDEYHSFMATYNAYKALGGDGWADGVKNKIETMERDFE